MSALTPESTEARYTLTPASKVRVGDIIMRYIAGKQVEVGRVIKTRPTIAPSYVVELETFGAYQSRYNVPSTFAFYVRTEVQS